VNLLDILEQVEANANPDFITEATAVVEHLAATRVEFTTDDVWQRLSVGTHEPRALGAVMRKAAKAGLIRRTNRVQVSVRPSCHQRPVAVWESC
jgi:hypothetical protein